MGVASFIIEDGLSRPDIASEIDHLEFHSEIDEGDVKAHVISFLTCEPREDDDLSKISSDDLIGQVCIITFPGEPQSTSYVYEALFRLPCIGPERDELLNNHILIASEMELAIRQRPYKLFGTYFCQQNGVTSICAHSAVRTLVRTLRGTAPSTAELNSFWSYYPAALPVHTDKLISALEHYGFRPVSYDLTEKIVQTVSDYRPDNIWGLLTLLADSASPCLLALSEGEPVDHVVPILGYTFNSDEWHPLGTRLHKHGEENNTSSHLWIDHLIMHDDMLGPYYSLSRAGLISGQNKKQLIPKLVIAILPDRVEVSPASAEMLGRETLDRLLKKISLAPIAQGRWWD